MWPLVFGVRTYSFVYALSMAVLGVSACWSCRRRRLPLRAGVILALAFPLAMVVGAKILYDLQHGGAAWSSYLSPPYYLKGGLWGGPLAYLLIAIPAVALGRRDWRERLDLIAWTLPLPLLIAKLACFVNGCCYGAPTNLPWAITCSPGAESAGVARHPTQLYEIAVLLTILAVYYVLRARRGSGEFLAWFMLLYGLGRPLTEVFRGDGPHVPNVGPLTASQAVCLAAAACGALLLVAHHALGARPPIRQIGPGPVGPSTPAP